METVIINVVNKLNAVFQTRLHDITNVSVENDDAKCLLTLDIAPKTSITWEVQKDRKFVKMRCDAYPEGLSEEEIDELGSDILEKLDQEAVYTAAGDRLTFQYIYAYAESGELDEEARNEAAKELFTKSMAFIQPLSQNSKQLIGALPAASMDGDDADDGMEEDEDPFGFDDIELEGKPLLDDGSWVEPEEETEEPEPEEVPEEEAAPEEEEQPEEEPVQEELSSAPEDNGESIEQLSSRIDALVKEASADIYNPNNYDDVHMEDEELDVLMSMTEGDEPGAAILNELRETGDSVAKTIEDACYQIADVHKQVKEAVDKVAEAGGSIFIREKEVAAREAGIKNAREELASQRAELRKDQQELLEMREKFEQEKQVVVSYAEQLKGISNECDAIQADNKAKADMITALSAERDEANRKAADAEKRLQEIVEEGPSGTPAAQAYLKELRKKVLHQDNYIKKTDARITEFVDVVKELQERLASAQATADAKAAAKFAAKEKEWKEKSGKWASAEAGYKEKIAKLEEEAKKPAQVPEAVLDVDTEELNTRIDELEEQLVEASSKLQASEMEKEELQARCEELQGKSDSMAQELAEGGKYAVTAKAEDPADIADKLVLSMKEVGITLSHVPGEAMMLLGGEFQECKLTIDVENRMLFITKQLRKPKRMVKDLQRLNNQDITTAYSLNGNELSCKAAVFDIDKITNVTLEIMKEMCSFA